MFLHHGSWKKDNYREYNKINTVAATEHVIELTADSGYSAGSDHLPRISTPHATLLHV